ncbi:hypothetical protein ANCCAN_09416 [Ancylostoma caninum]|uniref:guanylate cyclase n=1 Tax=Ancylostoma caninum TaxID=29170 RepID=A0A368GJP5_ANCCA|nr:hypothetical protein ANCCAN_09416 [Ancylostoma caninum]
MSALSTYFTGRLEGLNYIHHSFIGYHGRLTSACCLLTDAFQVKISDYGMSELTRMSESKFKLWSAPEVLNSSTQINTKAGDVFAFAIIAAETICWRPAWQLYDGNTNVEGSKHLIQFDDAFRVDITIEHMHNLGIPPHHTSDECVLSESVF